MYQIVEITGYAGGECYLIQSEKSAVLYDTGFGFCAEKTAQNLRTALDGRPLDYILLTHSHYDHVLGSDAIQREYPTAKTVCSVEAAAIFQKERAVSLMNQLDAGAAKSAGFPPITVTRGPAVNIVLAEGEQVQTADMTIRLLATPGHTRCSASYYFPEEELLAASETTGGAPFYPEVSPSFITSYSQTLVAFEKCRALDAKHLLVPHFGLLSGEEVSRFWQLSQQAAETAAAFVIELHEKGFDVPEIVEAYRRKFYKAKYALVQPEQAFRINAEAMIPRLLREQGRKTTPSFD